MKRFYPKKDYHGNREKAFFSKIATISKRKKSMHEKKCIKNLNLIDKYCHWKSLVDWISSMATSKMYIMRETQKLKNITLHNFTFYITISYWTATFHTFALKIENGWVTRMVMRISKTSNVNDDA